MLLKTLARLLDLFRQALFPRPFPGPGRYLRRLAVLIPFLLLFVPLQFLNWLGILLDEILFRGYRDIAIRRPLFILGVPRSGTTYLHRLLACDQRFSTLSTWECLFAPSISQRYLLLGAAAVDRRLGAPLGRVVRWLEGTVLASLDDVHPTSLSAAEEDYMVLLPLLCCFVLVVPFPQARWLWRMGRFDRDVDYREQRWVMDWYARCLQKHLYVHGSDLTLLSKNASFAGLANNLAERFPDSTLIICERDATQVIGSQFNSLAGGLALFGIAADDPQFRSELLNCLQFYYENLDRVRRALGEERTLTVTARDLAHQPRATVAGLYQALGWNPAPGVETELRLTEARQQAHRPQPQPPLSHWGLDETLVRRRFGAWCQSEAKL